MIPLLLFQLMILLSSPISGLTESVSLAKPGCPTSCGNVSIPFPFGIGSGCYLNYRYEVNCSSSNKPQLCSINLELLNISLQAGTMLVNHPIFNTCHGDDYMESVNLQNSPFFYSQAENILTGLGCDNFAYIKYDETYAGCYSSCDIKGENVNTTGCFGIQCCQTRIPSSLQVYNLSVGAIMRNAGNKKECKHAFLVQYDWLIKNIWNPKHVEALESVPLVLDWGILNSKFHMIERNLSMGSSIHNYSCEVFDNSTFTYPYKHEILPVHRCRCSRGFEGNPYLFQGCQDIDECKNKAICGSNMVCQNLIGGYNCYPPEKPKKIIVPILGIGTGLLFLLLISIGARRLQIVIKSRKHTKLKEKYFQLLLQQQLTSFDGNVDKSKTFKSKELDKATDHFNVNRILGKGGQGTVFKGMLADGKIIAVKKSQAIDTGRIEEFINEVAILSQINHRNVVKLLGCCLETEVPLLVYEFIPNGTLFQYLHDQTEEPLLTWEMRLQIAREVAGALSYLHSAASFPIYHRDIKSANILLDEKYRAKIADFGTSKSIAIDQTHVTTKVRGTFGYLDPEYFQSSQFTDKSDVYSFGVVLIELLTGQKPISSTRSQESRNLATHFILSMLEDNLIGILDPEVMKGKKEEIMTVAELAKSCLNLNGRERPTMKEIAMVLEGIQASQKESKVQKICEAIEYTRTDIIEPWDVVSTSTSSTFEITVPSVDVEPLLTK